MPPAKPPRPCPHCGSATAPLVLAFKEDGAARVHVVCSTTFEGCGAAGPVVRTQQDLWCGLAESVGLKLLGGCPEAQEAIAAWNVRADTYEDFERTRQAVAEEAALWRARIVASRKPCWN